MLIYDLMTVNKVDWAGLGLNLFEGGRQLVHLNLQLLQYAMWWLIGPRCGALWSQMWCLMVLDVVPYGPRCGALWSKMWCLMVLDVVPYGPRCGALWSQMWWLFCGDAEALA